MSTDTPTTEKPEWPLWEVFIRSQHGLAHRHVGSVHAAAMALLAESSTGFVVGVNLPGDKLPLIKEMNFKYVKRAQGDMHAVAHLTDEQIALMQTQEKGEVTVAVKVTDAQGIEPVLCEMIWAWVPKSRK